MKGDHASKQEHSHVVRNKPSPAAGRKRREGPEEPLKREQIVSTALAVVDRDGLKALSMRRLGAELGVDPMAVYYHIPNKQALLDAIVEAVMAGIDLSVDNPAAQPEERILCAARAYRDTMLAHVKLCLSCSPTAQPRPRPCGRWNGSLRFCAMPACRLPRHSQACR